MPGTTTPTDSMGSSRSAYFSVLTNAVFVPYVASSADNEIIIYSAAGLRKALPQKYIQSLDYGNVIKGGMESFTCNLSAKLSELDYIGCGDRLEFWYKSKLRYRGFIRERNRKQDTTDGFTLTGYSYFNKISSITCNKQYAYGVAVDVSVMVGRLFQDFIAPLHPNIKTDIQTVGFTVNQVDATQKSFGDTLSDILKNIGDRAAYGVDVDSSGNDVFFLRPINDTADLVLSVPHTRISTSSGQEKTSESATRLTILGGVPQFPNMVVNSSFENLKFASDGTASEQLLQNSNFESRSSWSLSGGASWKSTGNTEGSTVSGSNQIECDNAGELFSQTRGNFASVIAGHQYIFGGYVKGEFGGTASTGTYKVYWLDSSNATIATETISISTSTPVWTKYTNTITAPTGAAGFKFEGKTLTGQLLFDDCIFYDTSNVYLQNWLTRSYGSAKISYSVSDDSPFDGGYVARINATSSNTDGQDCYFYSDSQIKFVFQQQVRLKFRIRKAPNYSGASPRINVYLGNYSSTYTIPASDFTGAWKTYSIPFTVTPGSTNADLSGAVQFCFRGSGIVDIDAVEVRDTSIPDTEPFLRDGNYFVKLKTTDVFTNTGDDAQYFNAESTLGEAIYKTEDNENVTTYQQAVQFARLYFQSRAKKQVNPAITITDYYEQVPKSGQTLRLLGADGAKIAPNLTPIARVRETFSNGMLETSLELEREQTTLESIIKALQSKSNRNTINQSGQTASGGSGGNNSNTVSGGAGVSSVNAATGDVLITGTGAISATTSGSTVAMSLANTAVTPGTYTSADITVDASGRLTSAANGTGGGSGGVSSINSLTGAVSLIAGSNVSLSTSGSAITINTTSSGGDHDYIQRFHNGTADGVANGYAVRTIITGTTSTFAIAPSNVAPISVVINGTSGSLTVSSSSNMIGGSVVLSAGGWCEFTSVYNTTTSQFDMYRSG